VPNPSPSSLAKPRNTPFPQQNLIRCCCRRSACGRRSTVRRAAGIACPGHTTRASRVYRRPSLASPAPVWGSCPNGARRPATRGRRAVRAARGQGNHQAEILIAFCLGVAAYRQMQAARAFDDERSLAIHFAPPLAWASPGGLHAGGRIERVKQNGLAVCAGCGCRVTVHTLGSSEGAGWQAR